MIRPTSLFRMGGKLFQDGSSKGEFSKKNINENRVQSLSSSGRASLFSAVPSGKNSAMYYHDWFIIVIFYNALHYDSV